MADIIATLKMEIQDERRKRHMETYALKEEVKRLDAEVRTLRMRLAEHEGEHKQAHRVIGFKQ